MTKPVPMKKIWEARNLVRHGYSVKEISERLSISQGIVRSYTKAERASVKKGR